VKKNTPNTKKAANKCL